MLRVERETTAMVYPDPDGSLDISQGKQGDMNLFNIGGFSCAEYINVTAKEHGSGRTLLFGPFTGQQNEIETVEAAIGALGGPVSLEIMRDDVEWRFVLS